MEQHTAPTVVFTPTEATVAARFLEFQDAKPELPFSAQLVQFAGQNRMTVRELKSLLRRGAIFAEMALG